MEDEVAVLNVAVFEVVVETRAFEAGELAEGFTEETGELADEFLFVGVVSVEGGDDVGVDFEVFEDGEAGGGELLAPDVDFRTVAVVGVEEVAAGFEDAVDFREELVD